MSACCLFASLLVAPRVAAQKKWECPEDTADLPKAGAYNVLLIVLDDMGTDQVPMYRENTAAPKMPELKALSLNGVLFTNAYGNPVCSPTRACIQTGRYSFRTGIGKQINYTNAFTLDNGEVLIPEVLHGLQGATYATGLFGKWHLAEHDGSCPPSPDNRCHPVDNGYDKFFGQMSNWEGTSLDYFNCCLVSADNISGCTVSTTPVSPSSGGFVESNYSPSITTDVALRWISAQYSANQKFFACVTFNIPHIPAQVPPASLLSSNTLQCLAQSATPPCNTCSAPHICAATTYVPGDKPCIGGIGCATIDPDGLTSVYHASIEALDVLIGRLVNAVDLNDTMIFVIGDNGTGSNMIACPQNSDHGKPTLYQGGIRVPLIVAGPLVASPGRSCTELVDAVDLFMTVANVTGLSEHDVCDYVSSEHNGPNGSNVVYKDRLDSLSFLGVLQNPLASGVRLFSYSEIFGNTIPPTTPPDTTLPGFSWAIHDKDYKLAFSPSAAQPNGLFFIGTPPAPNVCATMSGPAACAGTLPATCTGSPCDVNPGPTDGCLETCDRSADTNLGCVVTTFTNDLTNLWN